MNFDGRAIANFILDSSDSRQRTITNLSLQKIIYFCHVWSLVVFGKPLIKQQFEAWQYGPVLQYLYNEFRDFESAPITKRATRLIPATGAKEIVACEFDELTTDFLMVVSDFYSQISPIDLMHLTHAKGSPWDEVWNYEGSTNVGMRIEDLRIQQYYSKVRMPFSLQ